MSLPQENPRPEPPASTSTSNPSPLLHLPPNIEELRTRFFAMESPITMPLVEFESVWRYLDNMYVLHKSRGKGTAGTAYYWCRLWRKHEHVSRVKPDQRQRNRTVRKATACPCRLKAISNGDTITFERLGEGHNHDYSALAKKLTTAVRDLAASEVAKGYRPCHVAQVLRSLNSEIIQAAGGSSLDLKAVHNAKQTRGREAPTAVVQPLSMVQASHQPPKEADNGTQARVRRGHGMQEFLDRIQRSYDDLASGTSTLPADIRDEILGRFTWSLMGATEGLLRETPNNLAARFDPRVTMLVVHKPYHVYGG